MKNLTALISLLAVLCLGASGAPAGEPFRYPEARHGKGELRYLEGLPVLTVRGSREEIGEQVGALALKPAAALVKHFHDYLTEKGLDKISPALLAASEVLFRRYPEEYRREMEAMIRAAGADRGLILLANNAFELQELIGCTGLLVGAERSAAGGPLYGRNFDFLFDDMIAEYSLVIVYRPEGRKAFASVTFPGLLASNCGINEDGLTLGANTVTAAADGSPRFDPSGTPYPVAAREVMERCASIGEFDRWIRSHPSTTPGLLLASDAKLQRVYEITPKNIAFREGEKGLAFCTNHFRLPPLAADTACWRYRILEKSRSLEKLSVGDVGRLLHQVNQGKRTIQTMVFEPGKLALHLSIGRGPSSAGPLRRLELGPLLRGR